MTMYLLWNVRPAGQELRKCHDCEYARECGCVHVRSRVDSIKTDDELQTKHKMRILGVEHHRYDKNSMRKREKKANPAP